MFASSIKSKIEKMYTAFLARHNKQHYLLNCNYSCILCSRFLPMNIFELYLTDTDNKRGRRQGDFTT